MTFKVRLAQHSIACVRDVLEATVRAISSFIFQSPELGYKYSTQKIFAK